LIVGSDSLKTELFLDDARYLGAKRYICLRDSELNSVRPTA
jgi:hypothetical protein